MFARDLAIKLPLQFDAARLSEDLRTAETFEFKKHPLRYHDGSWNVINLIYAGGDLDYRHEGDFGFGTAPAAPTEVLQKCPYFAEVLNSLPGQIKMARLSALPAKGHIMRHYDPIESVDFDNLRIHIPVRTDPKVRFYLGFERRQWRAGEAWYGDFTFPHSIHNDSALNRVHIIVDLLPDASNLAWFPAGYLDAEHKAKRARLRKLHKDLSWYLTRLEKLWGSGPKETAGASN
jgi:hypothetical protein